MPKNFSTLSKKLDRSKKNIFGISKFVFFLQKINFSRKSKIYDFYFMASTNIENSGCVESNPEFLPVPIISGNLLSCALER